MTPRIQSLLDFTFDRKQNAFRRDVDWAPLLAGFAADGVSDMARARIGLCEMLRAEGELPAFLDGERIAFTRTVRQIPDLHTEEEICEIIGADSIGFLRMEDLDKLTGDKHMEMCKGCFNGEYPVPPPVRMQKHRFEIPLSRQKENENEE